MEEGKAKQNKKITLSSTGSENLQKAVLDAEYMRLNEMFAQAPKRLHPLSRGRVVCTRHSPCSAAGPVSLAVLVTPRLGRHSWLGPQAVTGRQRQQQQQPKPRHFNPDWAAGVGAGTQLSQCW